MKHVKLEDMLPKLNYGCLCTRSCRAGSPILESMDRGFNRALHYSICDQWSGAWELPNPGSKNLFRKDDMSS